MKSGKIVITSIDDFLKFLDFEYDPTLPNAEKHEGRIVEIPTLPDFNDMRENISIEFKRFQKDYFIFDGRKLTVWRKIK